MRLRYTAYHTLSTYVRQDRPKQALCHCYRCKKQKNTNTQLKRLVKGMLQTFCCFHEVLQKDRRRAQPPYCAQPFAKKKNKTALHQTVGVFSSRLSSAPRVPSLPCGLLMWFQGYKTWSPGSTSTTSTGMSVNLHILTFTKRKSGSRNLLNF